MFYDTLPFECEICFSPKHLRNYQHSLVTLEKIIWIKWNNCAKRLDYYWSLTNPPVKGNQNTIRQYDWENKHKQQLLVCRNILNSFVVIPEATTVIQKTTTWCHCNYMYLTQVSESLPFTVSTKKTCNWPICYTAVAALRVLEILKMSKW